MADYSPLFKPGVEPTLTASATIVAGDALIVTGNETVGPSAGVSALFAGIAANDAATGEKVVVIGPAVHELNASGAINAGDLITTAAAADVAAFSGTTYSTIIGVAISAAASNKVLAKTFR